MHPSAQEPASGQRPLALARYSRAIGLLARGGRLLSAAGVLFCFAAICASVVLRYVFNAAPVWVDELVGFTLVGIVLLGAAATLRDGEHIAVDLLTSRANEQWRRRLTIWAALASFAVAMLLIFNGFAAIELAHMLGTLTEGYLEWPTWMLMLVLPVSGMLLALAAVEVGWHAWLGLPLPAAEGGKA